MAKDGKIKGVKNGPFPPASRRVKLLRRKKPTTQKAPKKLFDRSRIETKKYPTNCHVSWPKGVIHTEVEPSIKCVNFFKRSDYFRIIPGLKMSPVELLTFAEDAGLSLQDVGFEKSVMNLLALRNGNKAQIIINVLKKNLIVQHKGKLRKTFVKDDIYMRVMLFFRNITVGKGEFKCVELGQGSLAAAKCGDLTLRPVGDLLSVIPGLLMTPKEVLALNKALKISDEDFTLRYTETNLKRRLFQGDMGEVVMNLIFVDYFVENRNVVWKHLGEERSKLLYRHFDDEKLVEPGWCKKTWDGITDRTAWKEFLIGSATLYALFGSKGIIRWWHKRGINDDDNDQKPPPPSPPPVEQKTPRPKKPMFLPDPESRYRITVDWSYKPSPVSVFKSTPIPIHLIPHTAPVTMASASPIMGAAMATAKVGLSSEVVRQTAKNVAKVGFWATLAAGAVKVFSTVKTVAFGFARALPSIMFRAGNAAASGVLPPVFIVPEKYQTFKG
ncbi:MAG: hypothetical protein ABIE74_06935 [Pseudomonadota bacterium]